MADLFEKYKVDLVISGHVHNYQRTYPLKFEIAPGSPKIGLVPGKLTLDKEFDGVKKTKTKLPIYLVSGGARGRPLRRGPRGFTGTPGRSTRGSLFPRSTHSRGLRSMGRSCSSGRSMALDVNSIDLR